MAASRVLLAAAALTLTLPAGAADDEGQLPRTVVWTSYGIGTTGYSMAVAVGAVLKQQQQVNLRVLPGKNDVSRLAPLTLGRAQFAATGSDSIYAQEAIYTFGTRLWGPQPIRLILMNISDGGVTMAVAADAGVTTLMDLRGKRVTWLKSSPALNKGAEAYLSFAGLSWEDVQRVTVSGYSSSVDALLNGQADAMAGDTTSVSMLKLQASPRGLAWLTLPHDNGPGWTRLQQVLPWYFKHRATQGAGIPAAGVEMAQTAYPILVSTADVATTTAYGMTRAMVEYYDDYRRSIPSAVGWALERQIPEQVLTPFHEGAVAYFKDIGAWTQRAEQRQRANLARQRVLRSAWQEYISATSSRGVQFREGWMRARAAALETAGLPVLFRTWSTDD